MNYKKTNIISHGKDLMTTPQELTTIASAASVLKFSTVQRGTAIRHIERHPGPLLERNGVSHGGWGIVLHPHQHCQSNWLLKSF